MRVLITGGAGFIGSHLADRLLERGDEVLVIDNFATGRRDNLEARPGLTLVAGTIADASLVDQAFDDFQPQQVIHAAASYKDPTDWTEDVRTNVLGTCHIVAATRRAGAKRLIYFQTALCYGLRPTEQPIRLDHTLDPCGSSYAISKTAGENYIALSGLEFVSFRLANCYGPRNISGPLPTFFSRLSAGKPCFCVDTRRDFIFIDDLLAVVLASLDGQGGTGYYHISSGRDFSIQELYDATVSALGLPPDPAVEVRSRSPDDAFTILLDPTRTNQDFNWQADTPLETGVAAAVEYYKQFGVTQTYTHLRDVATK